jgi:peptidoglycan/LPS O-acetylase OafA/YrhL
MVACILLSSLASEFYFTESRLRLSILNFLQYFLTGLLLADFYLVEWQGNPARRGTFDLVGMPAAILFFSSRLLFLHGSLALPWLGLLVVLAAFRGVICNRFFTNRIIFTIGGMCYTIYLYHFAVVGLCGHGRLFLFRSFWPNLALSLVVVPLAAVAVSSVLFVFFEKPFMRRTWHKGVLTAVLPRRGSASSA